MTEMIDWFKAIKGRLEQISELAPGAGQVHTYEELPGTLSVFPTAIILPSRGSIEMGASLGAIEVHQVELTIYVAGTILPEGLGMAVPFIRQVADVLAGDMSLGGLVGYCMPVKGRDWYEGPGYIKYGSVPCTGIQFHLVVKEKNRDLTVT